MKSFLLVAEANKSKQAIMWTKHGEEGVMMEDGDEEEDNDDQYRSMFSEYDDTAMEDNEEEGGEERAPDEPGDDDLRRAISDARRDCGTDKERLQFNIKEVASKKERIARRPEGSSKGYGTEEVIEFCVDFLPDLKPIGVPESRYEGRLIGKGTLGRKATVCRDKLSFNQAHYTVLYNSSLVAPYIEIHKNVVREINPGQPESLITRQHMNTFGSWLQTHLMSNTTVGEQLYLLARLPSSNICTFQGYEINGNTFYPIDQDKKSTNQNSGVRFDAKDENGHKDTYYGYIEEIWELDYGPTFKVPLFRCKWVKLSGVQVDDKYGMTTVDPNNLAYMDEPFVLANEVAQVFYVKDMSSKPRKRNQQKNTSTEEPKRHIVLSGK
ncbi:hypothetical protein QYE76_058118 [Lolium multiflorum]|uniref:DUF4216 domain-containing protein n=1 Tax=Lolium multiflorum TaxID=4521 RepID=A0AAD8T5Y9_LOLMU|nr:hypothetical protein QYE76_058118 [Lolium multiflorum]